MPPDAQADSTLVVRHEGAQMLLPDELAAGHIPHIDGVHRIDAGTLQRPRGRLHKEIAQARLP